VTAVVAVGEWQASVRDRVLLERAKQARPLQAARPHSLHCTTMHMLH